jgi:ketosteroid isomerase-like protein
MSQENVEILRRMYEAGNRDDWEAVFRDAHPDCEATFVAGPSPGTHRGREAILTAIFEVTEAFDAWIVEPEEFFETEDRIVVIARNRLRPKGTDAEFEYRNGQIWTFRDGKLQSLLQYGSPDEALEAAGLRE